MGFEMDLHQLRCFISVAEHGSFTRAAASLGVTQSMLSHHVGQLEKDVRQALFHRNGRGVELSQAGVCWSMRERSCIRFNTPKRNSQHCAGSLWAGLL
jgi:LysR family transcriptional regulator, nitrogen assimilation regulatory protein